MCHLVTAIISTDKGVRAQRLGEVHVVQGSGHLNYCYSFDMITTGPTAISSELMQKAKCSSLSFADWKN